MISTTTGANPSSGGRSSSGTSGSTPTAKGHPRMFDIPFLDDNGSNFAFWHFRACMVLKLCDLWGIVDGSKTKPTATTDPDYADWISKDSEARAQITLTLKGEPLNSVLFATNAKDCWDKLTEHYEGKGEQKIVYLIDEVFWSTLSESKPLEPQINTICTVRAAQSLGPKLPFSFTRRHPFQLA
jgi:hypothetical protein